MASKIMSGKKYIVGIDEAGRGPLAGPVAVGLVVVEIGFDWNLIPGVGDSKQVSPKNREAIFRHAKALKKEGKLNYIVVQKTALQIDRKGIAVVIRDAISQGLKKLEIEPRNSHILLDGSLKAPEIYKNQKTIIKGDSKEKAIGLASIIAKVTRDAHMTRISKKYPKYDFEIHKGYGTEKHRKCIKTHGPIPNIHRFTYISRIV